MKPCSRTISSTTANSVRAMRLFPAAGPEPPHHSDCQPAVFRPATHIGPSDVRADNLAECLGKPLSQARAPGWITVSGLEKDHVERHFQLSSAKQCLTNSQFVNRGRFHPHDECRLDCAAILVNLGTWDLAGSLRSLTAHENTRTPGWRPRASAFPRRAQAAVARPARTRRPACRARRGATDGRRPTTSVL